MKKEIIKVNGMTCNSCTRLIETSLKHCTTSVSANYKKDTVTVTYNPKNVSLEDIEAIIEQEGYEVVHDEEEKSLSDKIGYYVMIGSFLLLAYILYTWVIELDITIPEIGQQTNLALLFLVGLLTGFHCVSMCGGFIMAYMTKNSKNGHSGFSQHLVYGAAKTVSYIIIGGIFGLIGGIISFSVGLRGGVAIFAGTFMVFYALNMMGLKFFRRFSFNPKWLSHWTANMTVHAKGPYKAPLITGLLSGLFIACGPLQAMYLYAAGTGSAVDGALVLAAFGLGTLPILLGFGGIASSISHKTMKTFLKISAIIVLILGIIMLNRGLTVIGSPYTFETILPTILPGQTAAAASYVMEGDVQVIKMDVDRYGWKPDTFTLKQNVPVRWEINVKELTGCNNEILVRDFGLDIKLKQGMNTVEFTPTKEGTVRWSCWMGMIPGVFIVTEDGQATNNELQEATAATASGGSCGMGGGCGCAG